LLHLLLPQMAQLEDSFGGENWSSYSGRDGAQGPPVLASDFGRAPNLTKSCRTAEAALQTPQAPTLACCLAYLNLSNGGSGGPARRALRRRGL
jgi:hypothetical protein